MTIVLDASPRGCGKLKKGAVYGGGSSAPGGMLRAWTWLLGPLWDLSETLQNPIIRCTVPPRHQIEIDPRQTLWRGALWLKEWCPTESDDVGADCLFGFVPTFGLADHVGESYYTPVQFATETKSRGPNRRIARPLAKKWAAKVPFPVFFSHNRIPVFESQAQAERLLVWAARNDYLALYDLRLVVEEITGLPLREDATIEGITGGWEKFIAADGGFLDWTPTWEREGFGLGAESRSIPHPAELVLRVLEEAKDIPEELQPLDYDEALYGASWFTYIAQLVDEEEDIDEDLLLAGVEKAIADGEVEV